MKGSLCVEEIEYRKDSYETEYKQICNHIPAFARFSLEEFFWGRLVVLTRIFGITINGKKTSSMVSIVTHSHSDKSLINSDNPDSPNEPNYICFLWIDRYS